jgi:fatty-acyl-CoA synthase
VLRDAAKRAANEVALVDGTKDQRLARRWTYGELLWQAERTARALLERFDVGEHVAVWASNQPEWVILEFGAALAGLVLVPVPTAYRTEELAHVLGQSGAAGIVLAERCRDHQMAAVLASLRGELPRLREVITLTEWEAFLAAGDGGSPLPSVNPDDVAQIHYTSGTTGTPRGALLHHRGLTNNARLAMGILAARPGEVFVNPAPMFHIAGCGLGALGVVQALGTQVVVRVFDCGLVLALAERERATVLLASPTMLIAILEHPDLVHRKLSALRVVILGGALVPPEVVAETERRLAVRCVIVYGQTEASPVITMTAPEDASDLRSTTVGRPLPHSEVKIIDSASGSTLACGEVGELCVRGYLVMSGYYDMTEATAATIDAKGWLHTGDLGSLDERGYLRLEGRARDVIIRGGENVYPREIENALHQHPSVGDVAVVGIPDHYWGERVAAFIRPAPGGPPPDPHELDAYLKGRLVPSKWPRIWQLVDHFPLTRSGKVQKHMLREQYLSQRSRLDRTR